MGFGFHVVNLGCKVNRVESDGFCRALVERGGFERDLGEADLIIVNTCTVTAVAEKKARKAVRHALSINPSGLVVVTGCAAAIDPAEFASLSARVRVVPKALVLDFIDSLDLPGVTHLAVSEASVTLGEAGAPCVALNPDAAGVACDAATPASFVGSTQAHQRRARVGLKVQDGCSHACTYCIVHVARGPERSTSADEVLHQAKVLAGEGAAEIVLTGINLGRYSFRGLGLAGLLEELLALGLKVRFRLSSIEPDDIDDELLAVLARADGLVCRHLHLPLQAGSDKVLREMGRTYSKSDFLETVGRIRALLPSISLTTDVICGFPGETEDEFAETIELCRHCGFSRIHVFPYSRRSQTPAAQREDQVPSAERVRRAECLRKVAAELRLEDRARRAGTSELAVVESESVSTTESYHEVVTPPRACLGTLVEVTL